MLPLILALTSRAAAADLATADATLLGVKNRALIGSSLADAGDVNGDGQVDVLIGAGAAGKTYLVSGPVTGTMVVSDAATAWFVGGPYSQAGTSMAGAGDVNADGYDDVIIGAPGYAGPPRPGVGAAYLVLGPVTGSFELSLADAIFVGPTAKDNAGVSVSSAGDVDGDGLPDLLVGAAGGYTPAGYAGCCSGAAYVVSGTQRGTHGVRTADTSIHGKPIDYFGSNVDGLGDVNGDGLDDFLIGATLGSYFGRDIELYHAGVSYVWFGPVSGGRLGAFDADVKLVGEETFDYSSISRAAAGDVDGDGLRDILIGSVYAGAAYLVRGGVTGTLLLGDADAKLVGEAEDDWAGDAVSGAGDVDADGHDDILVGAHQNGEDGTGAVYLVRGPVAGSFDLGRADQKLVGAEGDWAGIAVSSAGDLDSDGRADVLVGAPGHAVDGVRTGAAYVLYGSGF